MVQSEEHSGAPSASGNLGEAEVVVAEKEQRCGTCRGFRAATGECRMLPPTPGPDQLAIYPRPREGADDDGCESWAERVRR